MATGDDDDDNEYDDNDDVDDDDEDDDDANDDDDNNDVFCVLYPTHESNKHPGAEMYVKIDPCVPTFQGCLFCTDDAIYMVLMTAIFYFRSNGPRIPDPNDVQLYRRYMYINECE